MWEQNNIRKRTSINSTSVYRHSHSVHGGCLPFACRSPSLLDAGSLHSSADPPALCFCRSILQDTHNYAIHSVYHTESDTHNYVIHSVYHTESDHASSDHIVSLRPWSSMLQCSITHNHTYYDIPKHIIIHVSTLCCAFRSSRS